MERPGVVYYRWRLAPLCRRVNVVRCRGDRTFQMEEGLDQVVDSAAECVTWRGVSARYADYMSYLGDFPLRLLALVVVVLVVSPVIIPIVKCCCSSTWQSFTNSVPTLPASLSSTSTTGSAPKVVSSFTLRLSGRRVCLCFSSRPKFLTTLKRQEVARCIVFYFGRTGPPPVNSSSNKNDSIPAY